MTNITTININEDLEQAEKIWTHLYEQETGTSAFMSWEWMNSWRKHFSGGREVQLVFAEDSDGQPLAMLPIMIEPATAFGLTFATRIQIAGSDSLACSEHLGFLAKSDADPAIFDELLSFIWDRSQGRNYLLFSDMNMASRDAKIIIDWTQKKNIRQKIKTKGGCWQTCLPESWDELLANLSSNFRQQIRRSIRKIDNSTSLSAQQITDRDTITQAARKLADLNLKRMSSKSVNSCFNSTEMCDFFVDMTVDMVCAERAWLDVIYSDDEIIAATLHLVDKTSVAYYQGGFNEEFGKLRPMVVLFAKAMQRAIDNDCRIYDFLGGNEAYKQRWGATLQPYSTISALPDSAARNSMIQLFELYHRAKTAKQYYFP